jgi:hypothetical protein
VSTQTLKFPSRLSRALTVPEMEQNMVELAKPFSGVLNVQEAPYLAKGDGVSDDTAACQTAIDAAAAIYAHSGRIGMVFFPVGAYSVMTLTLRSGVWLVGTGWGSVIQARANQRILRAAPDGQQATGLKDCRIERLKIDGQMRNNSAWAQGTAVGTVQGIGIECQSAPDNHIELDQVWCFDTRLEGVYCYNVGVDIGWVKTTWCGLGTEADGSGIALDTCLASRIGYVDARDVRGQWGVLIQSSSAPIILENFISTKTQADGICIRGAQNVSVLAGIVDSPAQRGVNVRGDIGAFGPCSNISLGGIVVNNSLGGFAGISAYQVNNLTIDSLSISSCPTGISLEGAGYSGCKIRVPTFGSGVTQKLYNEWSDTEITGVPGWSSGRLFSATASTTWSALGFQSVFGAGTGPKALLPGALLPGRMLRMEAWGTWTLATGQTIQFKALMGATTIGQTAASALMGAGVTWRAILEVVAVITGQVRTQGRIEYNSGGAIKVMEIPTTITNLDLTQGWSVDLQAALAGTNAPTGANFTGGIGYLEMM